MKFLFFFNTVLLTAKKIEMTNFNWRNARHSRFVAATSTWNVLSFAAASAIRIYIYMCVSPLAILTPDDKYI